MKHKILISAKHKGQINDYPVEVSTTDNDYRHIMFEVPELVVDGLKVNLAVKMSKEGKLEAIKIERSKL